MKEPWESRIGRVPLPCWMGVVEHDLSAPPLAFAMTSVLWLQSQQRVAASPSGETELSRHPRHATSVDGDSELPLTHTRDAITLLCSTSHDDN